MGEHRLRIIEGYPSCDCGWFGKYKGYARHVDETEYLLEQYRTHRADASKGNASSTRHSGSNGEAMR